ncbi:hypothetical protein JVX92_14930 (plasmid) [Microbacterium hominis]|uniref:hypothetical protein n=1 Tax=Microbacterium hominis TaxID=162426 RepID=UPI001962689D|nr:hypothetical protein [Microbacterium hominis]QRY42329.1 hypothetical protein JVX92_14930 [Microbacterium hominis]
MDTQPDAQDRQTPAEIQLPQSRTPWRRSFGVWVTAGVVLFVIIGVVLLAKVPDWLLANWFPTLDENARAGFLGPAANVVLLGLGGVIAVVGVGLSLSRHHQELEAAERDRQRLVDDRERESARRVEVEASRRIDAERALRDRFVTTVKLLSDEAPVNRQAALFALGALADDWEAFGKPDEVQVCIEVITGYLRAPGSQGDGPTNPAERTVKQAGYSIINDHLSRDERSWSSRTIDLSGVVCDFRIQLRGAVLEGRGALSFDGLRIEEGGQLLIQGLTVRDEGTVTFDGAVVQGSLSAHTLRLTDGLISFLDLDVEGGNVNIGGVKTAGRGGLYVSQLHVRSGGNVSIGPALVQDETVVSIGPAKVERESFLFINSLSKEGTGRVLIEEVHGEGANAVHIGEETRSAAHLPASD